MGATVILWLGLRADTIYFILSISMDQVLINNPSESTTSGQQTMVMAGLGIMLLNFALMKKLVLLA